MFGCRLKMARAQKHFEELQDVIKSFLGRKPYEVVSESDAQPHHYIGRLHIREWPPPELSPIIGDIVHNGRSALDHLAWLLVRRAKNTPAPGKTQFPIFTKDPFDRTLYSTTKKWKAALDRWNSQTQGMASNDVAIIKRMQPYKRFKTPGADPLARLADLSNWDKHRELHFASQIVGVKDWRIKRTSGNVVVNPLYLMPLNEMAKEGTIVSRFEAYGTGNGEAKVDVELELAFNIAFGEASPLEGLGVEDTLEKIGTHVSDVLLTFKLRFEGKL
jgi:hypothetical protein